MTANSLRMTVIAIVLGLALFMICMGACIGIVMLNARVSPELAWFPAPVLALCIGAAVWAQQRWDIGLSMPAGVSWARIYAIAVTATLAGVCVAILQGAWYDMERAAELGPVGWNEHFDFAYAFVMPLVAAILAEVFFRGVMQTRIAAVLKPWTAILLVTAVNTASHRWGPDLAAQWMGYFALILAFGYLRWASGSLWPALIAHAGQNFALAVTLWVWGPFAQGQLPTNTLRAIALTGAASACFAVLLGRGLRPPRLAVTAGDPPGR
jgi:membrane protease YdiL (CAAX protease family)